MPLTLRIVYLKVDTEFQTKQIGPIMTHIIDKE
jgi:hypothetical protein